MTFMLLHTCFGLVSGMVNVSTETIVPWFPGRTRKPKTPVITVFRKGVSPFAQSSMSWTTPKRNCFCPIVNSFSLNFTDTIRMPYSSPKWSALNQCLSRLVRKFSYGDTKLLHDQSPYLVYNLGISAI